jgi:hypothetical protein
MPTKYPGKINLTVSPEVEDAFRNEVFKIHKSTYQSGVELEIALREYLEKRGVVLK